MTKINPTKLKIIEVAKVLFANNGFEGTSVRDIAKAADVNLAAINYHFNNKANLYLEVFKQNCEELRGNLEEIYNTTKTTQEFAWKMYQTFTENGDSLMNSFKMMLTNSEEIKAAASIATDDDESCGPPGQDFLIKSIKRDIGDDVCPASINLAVISIFTHVVHSSVMTSSGFMQERFKKFSHLPDSFYQAKITFLVEAVLNQLKNHPNQFKDIKWPS